MFEYIFGVPIDIWLDFGEIIITGLLFGHAVFGSHSFPCRSLLLRYLIAPEVDDSPIASIL